MSALKKFINKHFVFFLGVAVIGVLIVAIFADRYAENARSRIASEYRTTIVGSSKPVSTARVVSIDPPEGTVLETADDYYRIAVFFDSPVLADEVDVVVKPFQEVEVTQFDQTTVFIKPVEAPWDYGQIYKIKVNGFEFSFRIEEMPPFIGTGGM